MTSFSKAFRAILFFAAIAFATPASVSAQIITDVIMLNAPSEEGKSGQSISYEELTTIDPSTLLEVHWSDASISQMTAAELIAWYEK